MGRLIAILLGGAAIALYAPLLLPVELESVSKLWADLLGAVWYPRLLHAGPGLLAGISLVLLAVRGRDA